jgi:hypothetical protein
MRTNEVERLSGSRDKLANLTNAPSPKDFHDTLTWMINGGT